MTANGEAIKHLNEGKFWEIKRDGRDTVLIFKSSKIDGLAEDLREWDLPKHLIYEKSKGGEKGASIYDICLQLKSLAGRGEEDEIYLHNEKKGT